MGTHLCHVEVEPLSRRPSKRLATRSYFIICSRAQVCRKRRNQLFADTQSR